ncbi:MAG TPA: transposase [Gaiellaceae bacterium]|nr:transposase [Gaiellaceae bacterium]
MPRAPRPRLANAIYHVTARGNRGEEIFLADRDRHRFLQLLAKTVSAHEWRCVAYCLMTNHFHLILELPKPNLAEGMHSINGVYARWFNWLHGYEGHLFQRRYHAVVVESDHHLLESCRYVLLNPVRAGVTRHPWEWRWSSYRPTAGLDPAPAFLAADRLLSYFGQETARARLAFRTFVAEAPPGRRPF